MNINIEITFRVLGELNIHKFPFSLIQGPAAGRFHLSITLLENREQVSEPQSWWEMQIVLKAAAIYTAVVAEVHRRVMQSLTVGGTMKGTCWS